MATYRNIEFTMTRGNGYGQYYIHAKYRGKDIKAHTTDSEAWDYLDDDSNKEKHREALRHCYFKIVAEYEKAMQMKSEKKVLQKTKNHKAMTKFKGLPIKTQDRMLEEHTPTREETESVTVSLSDLKEEVRELMRKSFYHGLRAEAFSLPIDFDADKWIEDEINKTINK